MISKLVKLKQATERVAALQRDWERQRTKLLALPHKLGFASIRELKSALDLVSDDRVHAGARKLAKRKKRRVITDKIRHRLKELVASGKSNWVVAEELDISTATVQNIKASLGLTKKRK